MITQKLRRGGGYTTTAEINLDELSDDIREYVRRTMDVGDVFETEVLELWARSHGWVPDQDE